MLQTTLRHRSGPDSRRRGGRCELGESSGSQSEYSALLDQSLRT